MDNITHIYSVLREELNENDNKLKRTGEYNITNIKNFIKSSDKFDSYCSIIFSDALVLLNYKNKNSMLTKEDKEKYNTFYKSYNITSFIFSSLLYHENKESLFSLIYGLSYEFRNLNIFAKSKILLSLDETDISVLSHYNSQLKIDIKQYDLDLNMIKEYINTINNSDNLYVEFLNYLKFLYTNHRDKYDSFKEEMELTLVYSDFDIDEFEKIEKEASSNNNLVDKEFVKAYVKTIKEEEIKAKQYVK